MKRLMLLSLAAMMLFGMSPVADAKSVHVKSYTKKSGKHVSAHSRKAPKKH